MGKRACVVLCREPGLSSKPPHLTPPHHAHSPTTAGALNVICNFAELVVREMERDKVRTPLC